MTIDQSVPCTSLGCVYVYSMTGGIWSLTQTLDGFSTNSYFGYALSYSSTVTQFAVGPMVLIALQVCMRCIMHAPNSVIMHRFIGFIVFLF